MVFDKKRPMCYILQKEAGMHPSHKKHKVLQTISYKASYPYIGSFSARALSDAYKQYRNSEMFVPTRLYIGKIDGNAICNALWREMSFNPVRFGNVSPFMLNGRNNIYAFCDGRISIDMGHGTEIAHNIRKNLAAFLHLNALPNGQWHCTISTDVGYVSLGQDYRMYSMLARLRDCIKMIARQNVADFRDTRGPYRDAIIRTVTQTIASVFDAGDIHEERQDRYIELLDSIIDTPSGYGVETYHQAMAEKERLFACSANNRQR